MLSPQPLPFAEQIRYFQQKINLPTATYLDIYGEQHDYAFVVAGAHTAEIVGDFRRAVSEVIEQGGTLEAFRQQFDEIVAKHQWSYNGGRNWRTRIIYDTNLYSSYNHGRYQQQREMMDVLPYWEYQHNPSGHPRLEHMAWDGILLRADDPWWDTHYPIRAYGCHCTVQALDDFDLKHEGKQLQTAPPIEYEEKLIGKRSGNPRVVRVPKGVDPSFEHPKRAVPVQNVDKLIMQKLVEENPRFASLVVKQVLDHPPALKLLNQSIAETVSTVASEKIARGVTKFVGVIPNEVIEKLEAFNKAPQTAIIAVRDDDILHALRDSKQSKAINLPVAFWQQLPEKLREPTAILLQSKEQQRNKNASDVLLFIYKTESGKVAVKMDYEVKMKDTLSGKKSIQKLNVVRTASMLGEQEWKENLPTFKLLWGEL